jgi:flavorubredoxin
MTVLLVFGLWYTNKFGMRTAKSQIINSEQTKNNLLIVSQKSNYKDELLKEIIEPLKSRDIRIEVIDISELTKIQTDLYHSIVIIFSWEMWMPPKSLRKFLKSQFDKDQIYTVGTSGGGNLELKNIDGISGASIINQAEQDANAVIQWVNIRLNSIKK